MTDRPPTPPLLRTWRLPVDGGHVLQVREYGRPDGLPALVLHGGPGSGCSPLLIRGFDLQHYRVICPDQRGAGASTPAGATACNTTADLLADLHRLRAALALPSWLVVGGSWGAALALAHAADQPDAVRGLLLRASFLARPQDIAGFFAGSGLPPLAPLAQGLQAGSAATQAALARQWWAWEQALASGVPARAAADAHAEAVPDDALPALLQRYRVQSHYLQAGCWLQDPPLLARCGALPAVPTLLLHADDDRICPPAGAVALQAQLPAARLQWVHGAGHDPAHPAMAAAMVQALRTFAALGHFGPA